jgi:MerR family mercuric resistance operon transcriptional regulator
LSFIRRARDCGMPIEKVRALLAASALPANICASAKPVIASQLAEVRRKRAELAKLEKSLAAMVRRCEAQCDTTSSCCTIFEDIEASGTGAA